MFKYILLALITFIAGFPLLQAQAFKTNKAEVSFFSSTPIEDIQATSREGNAVVELTKSQLAFSVKNTSFKFKNSLMQEHFNEKYMESAKFPLSTFAGNINEKISLRQEGNYNVTATGKLTLHGVTQVRTIPGTIIVKKGMVSFTSEFMVKTADHKIQIPDLVFDKVAEEIKVNVNAIIPVN